MTKRSLLIATMIFVTATQWTRGQAADTAAGASSLIDTSASVPANTPVSTHVDTPVTAPANTRADTSNGVRDSSVDTPVNTTANTPVDTPANTPVNTSANTPDTPVDTPPAPVNTHANTSVDTQSAAPPRDGPPSPDTSAGNTAAEKKTQKIFLLPSYATHVFLLAVFVAVIAATLYYFFARRDRGDSRRFLTTTRLSVLDKLVQRACRHVESNYPDPALTPEAVCNSLVTGKAYLDALFMNELGINVQDFIIQVRVNAIKNRLSADHAARQAPDIGEICAECGFADRAEAERCFAAVCGGVGIAEFARFSKMQSQRR